MSLRLPRLLWASMSGAALATASAVTAENSMWYDLGLYGTFPQQQYHSFGASSPWLNVIQSHPSCEDGYIFMGPQGRSVSAPGPIILDGRGNLVWTETTWGPVVDVRPQTYKGEEYLTFWYGTSNGTFGEGYYVMLDSSYGIFKTFDVSRPSSGDFHEFRITEEGTALLTIYERKQHPLSESSAEDGWIIDSVFQEISIESGEVIFQWSASDHFPVTDSLVPIGSSGNEKNPFDYFHINSIDKNGDGDYIISSQHLSLIACISSTSGDVKWKLGGKQNEFADLSEGQATNMAWQHHVSWAGRTPANPGHSLLTIFDNGAYERSASYSRGMIISVDTAEKTATLIEEYVAPQHFRVSSHGSVQRLSGGNGTSTGNVLVGWGSTPAYSEFSADGELLCDFHFGASQLAWPEWISNYRTYKSRTWVGRPKTRPSIAVRPRHGAVYASWNGATEVDRWMIQSSDNRHAQDFEEHHESVVPKLTFETQLAIPKEAKNFLRIAAIDAKGEVLGVSLVMPRGEYTKIPTMFAPYRSRLPSNSTLVFLVFLLVAVGLCWRRRHAIRARYPRVWAVLTWKPRYAYQLLPLNSRPLHTRKD